MLFSLPVMGNIEETALYPKRGYTEALGVCGMCKDNVEKEGW